MRWAVGSVVLALALSNSVLGARAPARADAGARTTAVTGQQAAPTPQLPGGQPAGTSTVPDGTDGKVAGMAIPNVNEQQSPDEVTQLHSDGLNTIALFVWWLMDKQDSNTLAPDYKDGITETDANLELQIRTTEQTGMHVILVPIFYCSTCEGGWRGTIAPSDPAAWFASYQSFMDHYADIAQKYAATTLFIGSEMTSMEGYTSNWQGVITDARSHFSGQIGYEENWDVLGKANFLKSVDLVGLSAYFPLDNTKSPALSDLLGDWTSSHGSGYAGRNWVAELDRFAATTGKPILFGEVGYMSGDYAANQPFLNYLATTNWQLQSDLYQALLETFSGKSWWAGSVWWEWYISNDTTKDNSRSPRGKTAETMLKRWYAEALRPPTPQTPLALSAAAFSPDDAEVPRQTAPPGGSGTAGGEGAAPGARSGGTASTGVSGASAPAGGIGAASGGRRSTRPGSVGARGQGGRARAAGVGPASASANGASATGPVHRAPFGPLGGLRRALGLLAAIGLVGLIMALAVLASARKTAPRG